MMPHSLNQRPLTVRQKALIAPHRLRIVFEVDDLGAWEDARIADYVTIFASDDGGPSGETSAGGVATHFPGRCYTIRDYAPATGDMAVEFALFANGPATRWAKNAKIGDRINGALSECTRTQNSPFNAPDCLMLGDDSSVAAIARYLESSGPFDNVTVVLETGDSTETILFETLSEIDVDRMVRSNVPGLVLKSALERHLEAKRFDCIWLAVEESVRTDLEPILNRYSALMQGTRHVFTYWKHVVAAEVGSNRKT